MNGSIPTPDVLLSRFTPWDYVAFAVMLLCSGVLGVYCAFSGGSQNTIRQLLIGSGSLPVIPVSTSLMASFISAAYILGNAAEVYHFGTMYFTTFLSYCAMIPVTAVFYLPVFYKLGEFLERTTTKARCFEWSGFTSNDGSGFTSKSKNDPEVMERDWEQMTLGARGSRR